ncbi:MAG: FtsX-like permease family protein [Candidatus Omnitrophota bacterium]
MFYELKIALRYFLGSRKEKFISLISIISILGVATGVATLIIVIGVMTGFDHELRDRIIGTNSHIVIDKIGGLDNADYVRKSIAQIDGVQASAPFVNTQALLVTPDRMHAVVVRGIDTDLEKNVTGLKDFIKEGKLDLTDPGTIIIGKVLASDMFLKVGDEVKLVTKKNTNGDKVQVGAVFSSDMYDYDSGVILTSIDKAKILTDTPEIVSGVSVKIKNVYDAEKIQKKIQNTLGFPYYSRTWMQLNKNLFEALKLEKTAMFVILTLIVLVASFNIASTLIMMVMEKTKDIGIIKAIGGSPYSVLWIFIIVGTLIGFMGTALGVFGGFGLAHILRTFEFIKLPEDVYYMSNLPVEINITDVIWITAAAMMISLFSTLYPAIKACQLDAVEALRYE